MLEFFILLMNYVIQWFQTLFSKNLQDKPTNKPKYILRPEFALYKEKLNWKFLSANPRAIDLLQENISKIDWYRILYNPNPDIIPLIEANLDKISKKNQCFREYKSIYTPERRERLKNYHWKEMMIYFSQYSEERQQYGNEYSNPAIVRILWLEEHPIEKLLEILPIEEFDYFIWMHLSYCEDIFEVDLNSRTNNLVKI